jgi:hypothetical protein
MQSTPEAQALYLWDNLNFFGWIALAGQGIAVARLGLVGAAREE